MARTRHPELAAHARHAELVAVFSDPGGLHRDSFAKYAAAFFTISRSSLVLANSRRNRAFSASTSVPDLLTVTAAPSAALSLPDRLNVIQFNRLDSGILNRLAARLPPNRFAQPDGLYSELGGVLPIAHPHLLILIRIRSYFNNPLPVTD